MRSTAMVCALLWSISAIATPFPLPTPDLQCTQFDSPNGTIFYWNREIRVRFISLEDANVTIGLGLGTRLPHTVCWDGNSFLRVRETSPSNYNLSGLLRCQDKEIADSITFKDRYVSVNFDIDAMKAYLGGYEYNCEWRPRPLAQ